MSDTVKRMAELLKSGAKMLAEHCPECSSPLFDIKGKIYCINCNRSVVIIKDQEVDNVESEVRLSQLEKTILNKLYQIENDLEGTNDIEKIKSVNEVIINLLEILDRIKRYKK